ncbi:hypothetical protein Pan44_10030 [Caulifigura coniformis]|uniref:Penicillin-binding protein activator LpoB n=1 Tax=Caulifigura coniformis TaxID=2527983 RepID=A0A517SA35_9PLAN|nr:penicillin-binding protein activator LpoB [Caulifigura coniformis]QDT52989.1 hypothetical protein Pan44_10030 [Caulifigura coniformis]
MQRRQFLSQMIFVAPLALGCRGRQVAHVLRGDQEDMVGSHEAGAETWKPLVAEATCKLLAREQEVVQTSSAEQIGMSVESGDGSTASMKAVSILDGLPKKRVCFVGVENKSQEELGDYREQLYEQIDTIINESKTFGVVNRKFVEAGLRQAALRPDDLFVPNNRRNFVAIMEQQEQPFDYLLFARVTSGTTDNNGDYQRDYLLTLELVNVATGDFAKESAELRKGYHKSKLSKLRNYGA